LEDEDTENLTTDGAAEGLSFESRTAFIIDPKHRIRLIFNYPAAVGMNTAEVLRTVDCLQTAALAEFVRPFNPYFIILDQLMSLI
jgi:peroxiredoxin (alkyl hydroperoxide reductase subunit C)